MSRTFKPSALLLVFFCIFNLIATPLYSQSNLHDQVKTLFKNWDNTCSPGCSVAIIHDGEIVFKDSFGMADLEHGIPLKTDSMFYACSVSKQFVAMCILLLEEEEKLALDDDVKKFLPDFPDYGSPITIRHLLHHTSGIRDYFALWEMAGNDFQDYMPDEAVYQLIRRQKNLNFQPGEKQLYSNSCYFLLYKIIEKVSGKTLRLFADDSIFQPLGMKHSFFHNDYRRIIKNRAMGYYPAKDQGYLNMISRFDLVGSGGMFTCVEDFLPWDRNFYDNQLGKKDQGLIKKMVTSGKLNNGKNAGYALALVPGIYRGLEIIEHSGSLGGYRTHYLRFPGQHFSVVILSNISDFDPFQKTREISDIYLAKDLQKQETNFKQPKDNSLNNKAGSGSEAESTAFFLPAQKQIDYTGRYYSEELDCVYNILAEGKGLRLQVRHNPETSLTCKSPDTFWGPLIKIRFIRNSQGQVISFSADSGAIKNIDLIKQR
jgi:CubicO group peptidase (beta-lactamase class C family)